MKEDKLIEKILKEERIFQRCPAYPIFVLIIGDTFLHLGKHLSATFSGGVWRIKDGLGDLAYLKKDFPIVLSAVEKEIRKNNFFLADFKKLYEKQFKQAWTDYQKSKKQEDYVKIFARASDLLMCSVGVGHIIEPFSILGTHILKDKLAKKIKDLRQLSAALNTLTTPEEKSFSNRYDDSLAKISEERDDSQKDKLIEIHLKEYYWIKNSYAGSRKLIRKDVLDELKSLRRDNKNYFKNLKKTKQEIIKKYKINSDTQKLAERLMFITSWQDERKINILKSITELDSALYDISKEFSVDLKTLYLMMPEEILAKKFLSQDEVREREKCFLWIFDKGFENNHKLITGERAENLYNKFTKEKTSDGDTLNGTCASAGSAIGRAFICKTLDDIKNFKEGGVLIASMTRPEYLPAMKKAVAIVTDEGGITCHAAIVSRELGIPCVIGTKNATAIIKNGYLIEVKADHGAVKILEKK